MSSYAEDKAINYETPRDVVIKKEEATDIFAQTELIIPENGYFSWDDIAAVGNFAAADPVRWRTIAIKLDQPQLTQRQIARIVKRSASSVCRDLEKLKITGPYD